MLYEVITDLAAAQVYRYRELDGVAGDAIIARYDDGAVALAERRVGHGRVLVLTTTLDPYWNTLPLQPGYVPLLHETLKYLGAYVPAPNAFAIGDTVDLGRQAKGLPGHTTAAAALARGAISVIRTPSGREQRLASGAGVLRLAEPGFYEAHVVITSYSIHYTKLYDWQRKLTRAMPNSTRTSRPRPCASSSIRATPTSRYAPSA